MANLKIKKPKPTAHSKSEGVAPDVKEKMEKALNSKKRFGKFIEKMKK